MSNDFQTAAVAIRSQLLTAENLSDQAAAAQARLIATMLEQRRIVGRPVDVGAREIDRGYQALGRSLGSLRTLVVMHKGLSAIADDLGVERAYGTDESVQNKPGAHLRQVA